MGKDKGLLKLGAITMIEKVIKALKPFDTNIIIVSNNPEYKKFGYTVVEDILKDFGPAGGIHTALKHTKTEYNFFIGCDMPFVTTDSIRKVLENCSDAEITLAQNNRLQPLFGVYCKSCMQKLEELIHKNCLSMNELVKNFKLKKIKFEQDENLGKDVFLNINTPEEYKKIIDRKG